MVGLRGSFPLGPKYQKHLYITQEGSYLLAGKYFRMSDTIYSSYYYFLQIFQKVRKEEGREREGRGKYISENLLLIRQ